MLGSNQLLFDAEVQKMDEAIPIACDIQKTAGLMMNPEQCPRDDFEDFFERAEAAGHGDETVGQIRHFRLALVHTIDDVHFSDAGVSDLFTSETVRDDANGLAAILHDCIGDRAHEADVAAAVNERNAFAGQQRTQFPSRFAISGIGAHVGAAENTET